MGYEKINLEFCLMLMDIFEDIRMLTYLDTLLKEKID
jgi:hypothetical protein